MKTNFFKPLALLIVLIFNFSCSTESESPNPTPVVVNCPLGYSGVNCGVQKKPISIMISKVVITNFPAFKPNGSTWDSGFLNPISNNPDIYLLFINSSYLVYFNTSANRFNDAVAGTQYTYTFATPISITDVNILHNITLYNYNPSSPDDEMGSINFTPYSNSNGFPSIITQTNGANTFQVKFYVTYAW